MSAQSMSDSSDEYAYLARFVHELAIPMPFELETFGCWLEQRSRHPTRMIPASMKSGILSGLILRRSGVNYLYYEQQTSPYHQSHIVLCLAARILLGEATSISIDPRLVPALSPQMSHLMFGNLAGGTASAQAEVLAFLVLNQVGPRVPARKNLRLLRPLHDALHSMIPRTDAATAPGLGTAARFRLHRQIIEIRDAMLALGLYTEPQMTAGAVSACKLAGIDGDDLAAAVEASILASALAARTAKQPPPRVGNGFNWRKAGCDLASEAAWLGRVSQAVASMSRHEQSAVGRSDAG